MHVAGGRAAVERRPGDHTLRTGGELAGDHVVERSARARAQVARAARARARQRDRARDVEFARPDEAADGDRVLVVHVPGGAVVAHRRQRLDVHTRDAGGMRSGELLHRHARDRRHGNVRAGGLAHVRRARSQLCERGDTRREVVPPRRDDALRVGRVRPRVDGGDEQRVRRRGGIRHPRERPRAQGRPQPRLDEQRADGRAVERLRGGAGVRRERRLRAGAVVGGDVDDDRLQRPPVAAVHRRDGTRRSRRVAHAGHGAVLHERRAAQHAVAGLDQQRRLHPDEVGRHQRHAARRRRVVDVRRRRAGQRNVEPLGDLVHGHSDRVPGCAAGPARAAPAPKAGGAGLRTSGSGSSAAA